MKTRGGPKQKTRGGPKQEHPNIRSDAMFPLAMRCCRPRRLTHSSTWLPGRPSVTSWPAGWATDVPGISRNDQLRIVGNGVVPHQAAAALRWLLQIAEVVA